MNPLHRTALNFLAQCATDLAESLPLSARTALLEKAQAELQALSGALTPPPAAPNEAPVANQTPLAPSARRRRQPNAESSTPA